MSEPTDLVELLRKIGIRASREAIEAWLTHAAKTKASPAQITEQLCLLEQREREARNLVRREKRATIGSMKPLDRFDWNHPRSVDRSLYDQLHSTLEFIRRGENVLLRGQAGVGKTTLAQNLAIRALERGHTVRFCTLPGALADLLKQESIPATERRLRRYTTPDLLVLDELGYVPCDSRAADLLFHIVSRRHESRSVVIADSGHRDHPDRVIVIARIGIVITESERSDVFGWVVGRRRVQSRRGRSGATMLGSVSSPAFCA